MNRFKRDDEIVKVHISGIDFSLSSRELKTIVPILVAYALDDLKLSSKKSLELAIMTTALQKSQNITAKMKAELAEVETAAMKWKETSPQSGILVDASAGIIQKFLNTPSEPMSLARLFLKCLVSVESFTENDKDISEAGYRAMKGLYDGLSQEPISDTDFAKLCESLVCQFVSYEEEPLDCLREYSPILSERSKEVLIKCLVVALAARGKLGESEKHFLMAVGAIFKIEEEKFVALLKKARDDFEPFE